MNDSDSFFGSANSSSEYASRPRAVNPRTGQEQSWQRASNYAAPLDNPHGLIKRQLRKLIHGLSLRTDLARMLLTGAAIEDNAKADEIIAQAHSAAEIEAKANNGTAVHAALSRSFLGHETPAEYLPHVNAFAAELRRNGLTPVATEIELMSTQLGAIGHCDWVVKDAAGRFVVLDVKTGRLGDASRKFAVQCDVYAQADYLGLTNSEPIPWNLAEADAILAHIDPDTGATALYGVDLLLGHYGAVLAEKVRGWHKVDVLSPYVPPNPKIPLTKVSHHAVSREAIEGSAPASVLPSAAAGDHPGVPLQQAPNLDNSDVRAALTPTAQAIVQGVAYDFDELMSAKNDKAKLQGMASSMGCKDLAHNRRWLARWIIATSNGSDQAAAARYAAAKDDDVTPEVAPVEPPALTGDLSFIFKSIEGAKSEGAILALQQNVIERRGDHAWTDEMAEAARQKVLTFIAADGNAVSPDARVIAKISQATEQQHIASIWAEVTLNASVPENWTAIMQTAAESRMAAIMAAQPAPPVNPFGPRNG